MPKKEYLVTFFKRKTKICSGRIKSTSLEDAKLDADFKMLLLFPNVEYDDITAEEIL